MFEDIIWVLGVFQGKRLICFPFLFVGLTIPFLIASINACCVKSLFRIPLGGTIGCE